jgi:tetratricopeptide (TPR) repeat protein
MKWLFLMSALAVGLTFPPRLLAQVPEVKSTCVIGCGVSNPVDHSHEPSAAEERRRERRNKAIDRYNSGISEVRSLGKRGNKILASGDDCKAISLYRSASSALMTIDVSTEADLEQSKQRLAVAYQETIAKAEYNCALDLERKQDLDGAINYFRQALGDYPVTGPDKPMFQNALLNAEKLTQQRREDAIKAQTFARMQDLLHTAETNDDPSAPSIVLSKPLDPGFFVTADIYQSAKRELDHLQNLQAKLTVKIDELNHWRVDLLNQKHEFDKLHAEATHGEMAELISVIPTDAIFTGLLKKSMINPQAATELQATFERLKKAGEALANLSEARNEKELIKVQITETQATIAELTKELIKISKDLPSDSPERVWGLRTVKMLQMFGVTANAMLEDVPPDAKWWEKAQVHADFLLDLGVVANPGFAGLLATERIADRERRKKIISRAEDGLGGAIADNWNAKVYLSQKLERVKTDIEETQRMISAYEARAAQN